jgi:hypothetical protein
MLIALLGVEVVANIGPLAQGGLDEAFGLAVCARSVGAGEAVLDCASESYETFAPRPRPAWGKLGSDPNPLFECSPHFNLLVVYGALPFTPDCPNKST